MKTVLAAIALALLSAPAAVAQTLPAACVFSPAPGVPDGATATNAAMVAAREALLQWRSTRAAEIAACNTVMEQAHAELNAIERAHNQGVAETDAAIERFTEENAEYNARVRGRRADVTRPNP